MSAGSAEIREVPVDVLPPVPRDTHPPVARGEERAPFENLNSFYHPASGVVILGIDWFVFGTDVLTDMLALPIMCVLSFIISFALVLGIQLKWSKNTMPVAMGKAFIGAFLVAVPFPITGTLLGGAILVLSGLPHHPVDAIKKLASRSVPTR
jgi:hypothetical protein